MDETVCFFSAEEIAGIAENGGLLTKIIKNSIVAIQVYVSNLSHI